MLKWYEELKYQCPSCKKYGCFQFFKENKKFYFKQCSECGFEKKKEIVFAHYKHKDGKSFLKIGGKFKEVELRNFGNYMRVVEVNQLTLLK